ncbi:MAG: winged helix-turn-helix domain-containing protein, partial [Chloroflexota bacterium]
MTIPDFQSLMLPLLRMIADGRDHSLGDVIGGLAATFHLGTQERDVLLPSGRQSMFDNRVGWARTYLKKAGLIESTARGRFRITEKGLRVLRDNPTNIDAKFLRQYPEFRAFLDSSRRREPEDVGGAESSTRTPEETLENSYQMLRRDLAQELLERIKGGSPAFFEQVVLDLLVAMGYGGSKRDAVEAVGGARDEGIDGTIKEDKLGLDVVYVQAKRWEGPVGRPVVQAFAGSLEGRRARKGVLITTS